MTMNTHDKIVKRAASEVLVPFGVFQKGQSRTWIDDNGWFLTIIEFRPSDWGKGAHLHVGLHYLWNNSGSLTIDYSGTDSSRADYTGSDEKFFTDMIELAAFAKEKVLYYRSFAGINFAENLIVKNDAVYPWSTWNKMMICFLNTDTSRGRNFYNQAAAETKDDYRDWAQEIQDRVTHRIAPILSNHENLKKYVLSSIKDSRCFWREKSSMIKLKIDNIYG
jgi:hypothetical protein